MDGKLPQEFRPAFRYLIRDGLPVDIEVLDATLAAEKYIVYARICQDEVIYVGCTDRSLEARFREHLQLVLHPNYTDYRRWAEGKQISVVAYMPLPVKLLGRIVYIHRTLEAFLIAEFRPRFNRAMGSRPTR